MLESLKDYTGERIEPDEWALKMIAGAEEKNDGQGISMEAFAGELGISL